jgi:NAD(P)-dependent dehydrogenase (short-subunit alcohol dehydrogenase family)
MPTVSVVTGANSGIGRALSIGLARRGHQVYGTVRDPERTGKLQTMAADNGVDVRLVTLDVADDDSVRQGFAEVLEREGQIDVLINNAGVGGNAVVEEMTAAQLLEVTNVNVGGAVRCLQAALPGMRARGQGAIVNISSVVGRFGAIAQAPYVASKWALEGLSEQLALELAPFGIRVIIVEPGVTKSAIFAKNVDAPNATEAYDEHYQRMFEFYAAGIAQATDPFDLVDLVHEAITTDAPKLRYACSWGGPEILAGRQVMTDEDWVALGAAPDRRTYRQRFQSAFGLDITPPTPPG